MNRLIKAEWYKLLRSTKVFWFCLLAVIVVLAWNFSSFGSFLRTQLTLRDYVSMNIPLTVLGTFFVIPIIMVSCCMTFHKRLVYYEVMDGNRPAMIINSRIILYGAILTVTYILPSAVTYILVGIHNGVGDYDFVPFFILMFIILGRMLVLGVLSAILFKGYWGPVFFFAAADIGFVVYSIVGEIAGIDSLIFKLLTFTTVGQSLEFCGMTVNGEITSTVLLENPSGYLPKVIITTVIEVGLVYFLTYRKLKKRRYN